MILISMSGAMLQRYKMKPAVTTPAIPTEDWFRMWRVDVKRVGENEYTFFTNIETLYTFVIDSRVHDGFHGLMQIFLIKYIDLFEGRVTEGPILEEEIVFHKAADRTVTGVMNYFFKMAASHPRIGGRQELESWINDQFVDCKGLFPTCELMTRFAKAGALGANDKTGSGAGG